MTYVVHGATGAQGSPLFRKLVTEGKNVTAAIRHPQNLESGSAIAVDLTSVQSLVAAYLGAKGVFIHLPLGPESLRLQYAQNIAEAVGLARPKRVVISTSGWALGYSEDKSALAELIRGVEATGVSSAIIAPRLYLENLLLPIVIEAVKTEGVLPYPLRADYPVSWCSHLDVADVAAALLMSDAITGVVEIGQLPAVTGDELAKSFTNHLGREVSYTSLTPKEFGERLAVLFGAAVAADVVAGYEAKALTKDSAINVKISAQQLLSINPRTVEQWLVDIGV
ncbi:NAD(P)H-binding protein [Pectobacterium quasiaquaticum]|uniref:NAD(P)H-binding protein n=1 Tax=Pectobacterium quasiaquaticum TaxID=2774015 RepID=A0A9Q2EM65_9GAMM|nr:MULTISPECIES: NAD(P)H-binding protein [Pectobacterium]MBE5201150.1 NAD(P)H-binding protein [Pectobacterium quasiaquaticum]MBE5211617.1 NAD(P)H-binding protein [Pectobacterium quasiaquaticum]MBE5214555.1 NAD(P)H-binding protein [Pectobacterium quasiaquaticum]MBE5222638.1 NAD(P)H-binding protein [Pectobacterium quasiaquaticum]MBE5226673.1 NAD(P)H-binding protein [Pectobacterium quasiaquaticum]